MKTAQNKCKLQVCLLRDGEWKMRGGFSVRKGRGDSWHKGKFATIGTENCGCVTGDDVFLREEDAELACFAVNTLAESVKNAIRLRDLYKATVSCHDKGLGAVVWMEQEIERLDDFIATASRLLKPEEVEIRRN